MKSFLMLSVVNLHQDLMRLQRNFQSRIRRSVTDRCDTKKKTFLYKERHDSGILEKPAVHFHALAITQHMSTHWMPLNQAMSKAVGK
jgi:hypothetical protein